MADERSATGRVGLPGMRRLLLIAYLLPAISYPVWQWIAPPVAVNPPAAWWAVGASFLAVALASLASEKVRELLPDLFSGCAWLVTLHFFLLAAANDMQPFYAVGSAVAVLSTAVFLRRPWIYVAYCAFVAALATALFAIAPDGRKLAYWGGLLPPLALGYHRLRVQIAATELQRRYREQLESEVADRTRALSATNARLERAIEERERLEEGLRLAQKMEALGRLAGGLAHGFNNLFTTIGVYAELLLQSLPPESPLRAEVEQIQRTTRQAAGLTRELLTLSRRGHVETADVDLDELLEEMKPVIERVLGEDILFTCRLGDEPRVVRANRGQLEQSILNLVINARDAMPHGGNLRIETWTCGRDELPLADPDGESATAEYVALAVTDDGIGMNAETRARAFEPFFTTKEGDRGTGLGLAIVYGIVRQGGGHVRLLSEPGKGTRFELYFPRCVRGERAHAAAPQRPGGRSRGERLLLVEDEAPLREALRRMLADVGYQVDTAPDGLAALALVEERSDRFDLVVSDVVMPRLSGLELAARLAAAYPRTRLLLLSGHLDHPSLRDGVVPDSIELLAKPFEPEALMAKVREVLDRSA